jgi:acyl-coenzyme A thioesterase PaaI-like protein
MPSALNRNFTIPDHWKLQPTSRMCFVCGRENGTGLQLKFYEDREAQKVYCPLWIPADYQGYPGITHGGILATILDEISGRALALHLGGEVFWVTAKMEVRYRKPTPTEQPLMAVGWVVETRRRSAIVGGAIHLPDGSVSAEVESVIVRPDRKTLEAWLGSEEAAEWKVV